MEGPHPRPRKITKDELNIVEFPVCLPCHRHPKGRSTILIAEEGNDPEGRPISRHWKVEGLKGLPLAIDEEVILGLMHMLHLQGFKERHVYFTQHSFLQLLDWNTGLSAYKRLKQSLDRLRGVNIESKGIFWDHKRKCRVTDSFNLIDSYSLYERDRAAHDEPFISRVSFSEVMFNSFQSGFIKTLDFDFYLSLKLPIARKLFRYLDKQAHQGQVFDIDLMRLAEKLAITGSAYPSKVKEHLEASHKELLARGFLTQAFYIRRGRSPSIRYTMAPRESWVQPMPRVPTPTTRVQENPLVVELVKRGVTRVVARSLLERHDEKLIADKLEVFDDLVSTKSELVTKNHAGFLRASIEKDFAPPTGYISRAERQRRNDEDLEMRRRKRELEVVAEKSERERQETFDALWSSLTHEEQAELEGEVLVTLNAFTRKAYHQEKDAGRVGPGHHALRTGVAKLLDARRSTDPSPAAGIRGLV